ncbi:MAG: alanine racemase [Candidatus Gracilibacteria bacterium]|nr:alanine racemase [Candidatus Gracilibacteria bacterium]
MSILSKLLTFKRRLETPFETLNKIYISKEAILNNFDLFQDLNPDYSIFPVLKSNAYGHGIKEIAKILKERKLDYIVVDSYYEALKVREVNKTPLLLIGYTLPRNLSNMDFSFVSLVVYDFETLSELVRIGKRIKIHLKVDTGMNRQGIYLEQVMDFVQEVKKHENIILEGICTHLADADSKDNDYSQMQIVKFKNAIEIIESAGIKLRHKHLSNSAGAVKFKDPCFSALRLGISLYGVNPLEKSDSSHDDLNYLKLALSFESTVILIKDLKKGEKVSYNGTYEATDDMKIAIIPVGYYEALSRKLSNNYFYNFSGKNLPIIGRICMNLTVIDVTGTDIKVGDKVEIISAKHDNNIYEIASRSETITYECFTRLAESIRRKII